MSRASSRIDIDLSKITAIGSLIDVPQGRIVQVLNYPASMAGVEINLDDDATWFPIVGPLKLQAADSAEPFQRISIRGPVQSGVLVLFVGDDPIPLLSASPGGAGSDRWLDFWYGPHVPTSGAGGVFSNDGMIRGGIPFPNMIGMLHWGATANDPRSYSIDGRAMIVSFPGTAGRSGLYLNVPCLWSPRAALGPLAHHSRVCQSWHLETEVVAGAAGGTDGLGSGMWFVPTDGIVNNDGAPDNPVNPNAFFGVVRNGAGGWKVAARAISGAGLTIDDDITGLFPSITRSVRVHIAMQDADGVTGLDGSVQVYLNEKLARAYGDMSKFPIPSANGSPSYTQFRPYLMSVGAQAPSLRWANIEYWTAKGVGIAQ